MAKIFSDTKLRDRVSEYLSTHNDFYQWIKNICNEYQKYREAEKRIKLYPEELAYSVLVCLNDIDFIKNLTHFHPLHVSVLSDRLQTHIFIILDICKVPLSQKEVDTTKFYHDIALNIILAICRKIEGKTFFHKALNIFNSSDIDLCLCWELNALLDISAPIIEDIDDLAQGLIAYSIRRQCARYTTLVEVAQKQSEKKQETNTDVYKELESIKRRIQELQGRPQNIYIGKLLGSATGDINDYHANQLFKQLDNQ